MSTTPKAHLVINQGATFRHRFTWLDVKGRPIDIAGFTARMQIRESIDASAVLLDLSTANGAISLAGAAGTVQLYISETVTANQTWSKSVYDLLMTAQSGEVYRMVEGTVTLSPGPTK